MSKELTRWALSTLRQRHSTSRERQCTFDDHGGACDAVFVSTVVSVALVTMLETEEKAKFRKSVANFSSYFGGDDWMNRR